MMKFVITLLFSFSVALYGEEKQYDQLLQRIDQKRQHYLKLYKRGNQATRKRIIKIARGYLLKEAIPEVFARWYGTPWNFYGNSRTPGEGHIACGYFVMHTLYDLGFKIPRTRWAQSASEPVIKIIAPKKIKRFLNRSIDEVKSYLKKSGNGLYMVGLDRHVGFIYLLNGDMRFVHANYYQPKIGVMAEQLDSRNPLKDSKYRVIGKLLSDQMVVNWLKQYQYPATAQ